MRSPLPLLFVLTLAAPAESAPVQASQTYLAQGYAGLVANALYQHYALGYPAPAIASGLSPQQAGQAQIAFVRRLTEDLGPVVGYKLALTSDSTQQGVNQPLYGFLLEDMLKGSGTELPADFATRPIATASLMVRVGSADINTAQTDAELLASLDAVIPFLELPDLVYEDDAQINASALVAANLGARVGIMGEAISLGPDWQTRLGEIRVVLKNESGQTVGTGDSAALLGHPLQGVRWLRDTLSAQGIDLRPGDLISLGSMTPPVPLGPGTARTAVYFGLVDDPIEVSVSIRAARE